MPHSSGGGSHSGGSHSSHSSHSHSSHSHGGTHYGGINGGPRVSRRPFRNCRRFMYYDRLGTQRFVYSRSTPRPSSLAGLILILIFMVPFITSGFFVGKLAWNQVGPPKALTPKYSHSDEYINDFANIIQDPTELNETLGKFEKKTGICPFIMTVYDSNWKGNYVDLEKYAYSLYVNAFEDEQHFLVVYSVPDDVHEREFVDWSWEGMQGDDTDSILTERKYQHFQKDLQKYLTINSMSLEEALNRAFANSLSYIMTNNADKEGGLMIVFFAIVWNLVTWSVVITSIRSYIVGKREYTEMPMYDGVNDGML